MEDYRVHAAVAIGSTIISGPVSDPYGCPNSPNGKKYNFRLFRFSDETYDRCAHNISAWVEEVAIPWFKSNPQAEWSALPWPNKPLEPIR